MNINSLNLLNNYKTMKQDKNKKSQSIPSFSGCVVTQDAKGRDLYKFTLPNAPAGTKIALAVMSKDSYGNYKLNQEVETFDFPQGFKSFEVSPRRYGLDENNVLGYKFFVDGNEYTDKGVKGEQNFTIAQPLNYGYSSRPRQMEHVLVDAFNVDSAQKHKRNHFNLLGGTIKSVTEKVPELANSGIRNILGTPIFGQDNKSSHGYWTTNPYQITDNFGNFKDFRDLMISLYKNGMSWTADGAFVNEGLEGIHIKDMMTWRTQSPFFPMFETKDFQSIPFRYGILSKNPTAFKHTHIQLINAPYKIVFERYGDVYRETKIVRNRVDASKPTYIQIFDDRLASEKQMNGNQTFNVYDKKETKDRYEIANYKDSVQPYNFRVSPAEVDANYHKYKEIKRIDENVQFKDALMNWSTFNIVNSNKDGGISLWVGNSDIAKKRFVLPESVLKSMKLDKEKRDAVYAAQYQVQDDMVQVGSFWTGAVAKMLTEYTAKELGQKVNEQEMTYERAVDTLVKEGKLPKGALAVLNEGENNASPLANILSLNTITGGRKYYLKSPNLFETLTEGVMSYPFDAIEFSPDLMSVLAYPYIKNLAVSSDTVGKSRYEMYLMNDKYYDKLPEKYRDVYKKTDLLLAGKVTDKVKQIINKLQDATDKSLYDNKDLSQEGKEIYSLLANDITKFLIVSALAPDIQPLENPDMLEYNINELHKVDLNKLNLQYETSPEKVAISLLEKIENGIDNLSEQKIDWIVNHLAKRIQNIDSDAFNVAKLIIEKTESGLDWRIDAAKDVGDNESKMANKFSADKNIDAIYNFWNKFNSAVRKQNPYSYTIGELTDESELKDDNSPYSSRLIRHSEFLDRTGFSTISDYAYFYNYLARLYGQDSEGKRNNSAVDVLNDMFKDGSYFDSGLLNSLNFMHRFVGNQDKPRILHLLAVDVDNFNIDKSAEVNRIFEKAFYNTPEFNNLSENNKKTMLDALNRLRRGVHLVNKSEKHSDPENFGIRPFDLTIDDIVNESCILSHEFKNYVIDNKEQAERLKANILKNMLEPAMKKYKSILFAMVGLPGNPTNYAGDELGMTGWETYCKNEKQENRNALNWARLEKNSYKFLKDYKNDISNIMNIRNKEAASALVNGATQPLAPQKLKEDGYAAAFYRYNDKTDAIVVLHSKDFGPMPEHSGSNVTLDKIKLDSLGFTLPKDTIYVNALDVTKQYKVFENNEIKQIDEKGNSLDSIELGDNGIILLRKNNFEGKKLSFKGNVQNPAVKLLNTKFMLKNN